MKVFICKFFNEEKMEDRVNRLVSREKKRAGDNLRVFCTDEQSQKRLEVAGISSGLLHNFWNRIDTEAESDFEKVYQLSDQLHLTAENNDALKYHGINFLSFEYDVPRYVRGVELSGLCRQMREQNCEVLVLVVSRYLSPVSPNINTPGIKTIKYRSPVDYRKIVRIGNHAVRLGYSSLKTALGFAQKYVKRPLKKDVPAPIQETARKNQRALFIVSPGLYARPAQVICNECEGSGITPYVAPYDSALVPPFQQNNIEYANIARTSSLVPFALELIKSLPLFFRLRRHISSFGHDSDDHDANLDAFFSVTCICKSILQDELSNLCFNAIYSILFLERMVTLTSPDIICLMPDGRFLQQMAAAVAKRHNIPTLACSAAFETGNPQSYMKHLHADKLAAMGDKIKSIYEASGVEPERVIATGIAHFDGLFNRDTEKDRRTLLDHSIDPDKPFIVLTTDPHLKVWERDEMLIGVVKASLKIKDMQLAVKVHPTEEPEPYQAIVDGYHDARLQVVKDIDLYALLSNCDLLVTTYSTTALEAMIIDKPVVVTNLSGRPIPVPYAEEGAALGVYRYEDIEPGLLKVLYNEETRIRLKDGRDRFVRAWSGEPNGRASERIVALMKDMIKANTR